MSRISRPAPLGPSVRPPRLYGPAYGLRLGGQVVMGALAYVTTILLFVVEHRIYSLLGQFFFLQPRDWRMAPVALFVFSLFAILWYRWPWFLLGVMLGILASCFVTPILLRGSF